MKKRIVYLLFITIFMMGFVTLTSAQNTFDFSEITLPPPLRHLEILKLSEVQKNKIYDLQYEHHKKMIDLRAELQLKILEMKKLRNSDELNRNKIVNLTKEINDIRNKISIARVNHQMDIYEILDDSQKKIWRENFPIRKWNKERRIFRYF